MQIRSTYTRHTSALAVIPPCWLEVGVLEGICNSVKIDSWCT